MTNSKQKGKRGELEIANLLKRMGFNTRRTAQYNGKENGSLADVIGLPGIHIEVKRVEKLNIDNAMDQAVRDSHSEIPTVWHRRNGKDWLVTLRLPDFMEMYICSSWFDELTECNDEKKKE